MTCPNCKRLEAERDTWQMEATLSGEVLGSRIAALEAERDRLREALETIAGHGWGDGMLGNTTPNAPRELARAALTPTKGEGDA